MFAVITTDSNSPVEDVYIANTHEEAVGIARLIILRAYAEDIDYWRYREGEGARNMLRSDLDDFHKAITMTWNEMQNDMSDGVLDWIHIIEVSLPPGKPDMKQMCIEFPLKQRPCGGCLHERECDEPRMPDVGMMQE